MDSVLILMRVLDTCGVGMLRSLCRDCIEGMYVVLHVPTIMTISNLTFHPLASRWGGTIDHYNRWIWQIVLRGEGGGSIGGCDLYGSPIILRMSSFNQALQPRMLYIYIIYTLHN